MIVGDFREGHPRVVVSLPGREGVIELEFIIDTGFSGDLCVSHAVAARLETQASGFTERKLADGSLIRCPFHAIIVSIAREQRVVWVLELPGEPLMGTDFLRDHLLQIEMTEGGEVTAEPL